MQHVSPLVGTLVVGIGLAFLFGTLANRARISPLVGYLVAGVAVGPFTPGIMADASMASQLAEIGVILLMFGVGLHFSLKDLLALWSVVVPGAVAQVAVTISLGLLVGLALGWPPAAGFAFGLALSISSTVVLTRALQGAHLLDSERGHLAFGWLIVQDVVTIVALVVMPPLYAAMTSGETAGVGALAGALGGALLRLAIFAVLMFAVGKRVIPALLHYVAHTGSRELFRLAVLTIALVVAFAAATYFGVSLALGAFFAGMILSESELSQRAAEETLPLRDAFAVLFFVSIGMLFDPYVIAREPVAVILSLLAVIVGTGGTAYVVVRSFGYSFTTALTVGVGLAQIGEFSFILADLGVELGMLTDDIRNIILATSILSIFLNPALFAAASRLRARGGEPVPAESAPAPAAKLAPTTLTGHAVLVGYGRVGQMLGENLVRDGWPLLVIEDAADVVEKLRARGIEAIEGNAAQGKVLGIANLAHARVLIVAIPNGFEAGQIVEQGRRANPELDIVARAHFDAEVDHLIAHGANTVIMGEREIARAMLEHVKSRLPRTDSAS